MASLFKNPKKWAKQTFSSPQARAIGGSLTGSLIGTALGGPLGTLAGTVKGSGITSNPGKWWAQVTGLSKLDDAAGDYGGSAVYNARLSWAAGFLNTLQKSGIDKQTQAEIKAFVSDVKRNPNDASGATNENIKKAKDLFARAKRGEEPIFRSRIGVEKMYQTIFDQPGKSQTHLNVPSLQSNNRRGR